MDQIRVVIADDMPLFRLSVKVALQDTPDIDVVAEAGDGRDAVQVVIDSAPDVVLMDLRMPGMGGILATEAIHESVPSAKVIILTVSDDEDDLFEAIKAGANAYLLKDIDPDGIADAIRRVHAGESPMSPSMASKLLGEFASMTKRAEERKTPEPRLTSRELEILTHVSRGLTNRQVAGRLYISENTVKNHIRNVLEKLHLHSKMEAVLYALRERLIDLSDVPDRSTRRS